MHIERPITPPADPASHDPAETRPESAAQQDAARAPDPTDRYMRLLDRLVDLGMEQIELLAADTRAEFAARSTIRVARVAAAVAAAEAEAAGAEIGAPGASDPAPERAPEPLPALEPNDLAVQRLSRAVRLCMALAIHLHHDRLDREAGLVKGRAAAAAKPVIERSPKEQLEDRVKDKIEREAEPGEKKILLSELRERLEEADVERDLKLYPIEELALRICRDLGAGADGNFQGMGTLIIETVIIDPPPQPGEPEPVREQPPPELLRKEVPQPLHIIRAMNRRKPPNG